VETAQEHTSAYHRHSRYFYVPRGTKVVAGYATGVGTMLDGGAKVVHTFDNTAGYFNVPVPVGQDGKLWLLRSNAGTRYFMTVPPYLARTPSELLLPAEVVARDAPGR
jgi:hypothetical protein